MFQKNIKDLLINAHFREGGDFSFWSWCPVFHYTIWLGFQRCAKSVVCVRDIERERVNSAVTSFKQWGDHLVSSGKVFDALVINHVLFQYWSISISTSLSLSLTPSLTHSTDLTHKKIYEKHFGKAYCGKPRHDGFVNFTHSILHWEIKSCQMRVQLNI